MRKWKQRLIMLLCMAMLVPMFAVTLPQEAKASSNTYVYWDNGIGKYDTSVKYPTAAAKIMVEQGQKFILSDYITVSTYNSKKHTNTQKTAYECKGYKYKSSKSKIASVSKKGVLTTKKTGTTQVTVKVPQKGARPMVCTIQVVKKGSLTKQLKNSDKANTVLSQIEKYENKKINDDVAASLYGQLEEAHNILNTDCYNTWDKSLKNAMKHNYGCTYSKDSYSEKIHKLVMPKYGTYLRVRRNMADYVNKQKPAQLSGTAAVTQGAKSGAFTLSSKLTTAQFIRLFEVENTVYNTSSFIGSNSVFEDVKKNQPVQVLYANDSETDHLDIDLFLTFAPNSDQVSFATSGSVDLVPGNYVPYDSDSKFKNLKLSVTQQ